MNVPLQSHQRASSRAANHFDTAEKMASRRKPQSKFFASDAGNLDGRSETLQLDARPHTNHYESRNRDSEGWGVQDKTVNFNPSKTSMVFRNMGNMMLQSSAGQPGHAHIASRPLDDHTRNLNGTNDSIGNFMRQFGGKLDSTQSPPMKSWMKDSLAPVRANKNAAFSTPNMVDASADFKPRIDQSINLDSLISKNEERLRFLEKYRGLESIDEQLEGTTQTVKPHMIANNKLPSRAASRGIADQSLGDSQGLDNLEDIINKYK